MLSVEEIRVLKKYNIDLDCLYEYKDNIVYKYVYMDGLLIFNIMFISDDYFKMVQMDKVIETRKNYIKHSLEKKDYSAIFAMMEKPYRMLKFEEIFDEIPDEQKYEVFLNIYTSMEYNFNDISEEFLDKVLKYKPKKEFDLPEEITIYRGEGSKSSYKEDALSWTTDIETAKFFAKRFNSKGRIYKGIVNKSNIIDYIANRGESEILVKYDYITDVEDITDEVL